MPFSNISKNLLKFAAPALYVICLFRFVDIAVVINTLSNIRFDMVCISLILFPLLATIQIYRWWIICHLLSMKSSFLALAEIYFVAWFLRIIPFVGATGIAKIVYLKNQGELASKATASVFVEKSIEMIGLFFFGAIGLLYLPKGFVEKRHLWFYWGTALFTGFIAILVILFLAPRIKLFIENYLDKQLHEIGNALKHIWIDLWAHFSLKFVILQLLSTLTINIIRAAVMFLLAVSLEVDVLFMQMLACTALIGLANILPISINGLGTRDAILVLMLPLWGVSKESALALGLTAFLWVVFTQVAGMIFWLKLPLPFKALIEIKKTIAGKGEK